MRRVDGHGGFRLVNQPRGCDENELLDLHTGVGRGRQSSSHVRRGKGRVDRPDGAVAINISKRISLSLVVAAY